MNLDIQICPVAVCTDDMHPVCRIEYIYDFLLHISVECIIKSINLYSLRKNFLIIRSDCSTRIGNNRKASVLAVDIAVHIL